MALFPLIALFSKNRGILLPKHNTGKFNSKSDSDTICINPLFYFLSGRTVLFIVFFSSGMRSRPGSGTAFGGHVLP